MTTLVTFHQQYDRPWQDEKRPQSIGQQDVIGKSLDEYMFPHAVWTARVPDILIADEASQEQPDMRKCKSFQ